MQDRIKKLRKQLDLTQASFGERIGLKGNTIAQYESGRNLPPDVVITAICREYDVNETWLRTGEGELFIEKSREEEIAAFMGNILKGEPDFRRRFISVLSRMTMEEWQLLERKIKELNEEN